MASWIEQGYIAGPFRSSTLPNSCFISMMAIEQETKVLVIMNLSDPAGASLNDFTDNLALEKVPYQLTRLLAILWLQCGPGTYM